MAQRRLIVPRILGRVFRANPGERLNVADFMIAPSLALILYRPDVKPMFEGRPALELVDRLLPEPA